MEPEFAEPSSGRRGSHGQGERPAQAQSGDLVVRDAQCLVGGGQGLACRLEPGARLVSREALLTLLITPLVFVARDKLQPRKTAQAHHAEMEPSV
ncbi:MAG TPA: hypothetical protein V6D00_08480 [Pantanalinema sp.]